MLCCYGHFFLAKLECVGTRPKLCSSRISSPSFTFSVILNVIHCLMDESQVPHGSECQGGVMSCSLVYGCATSCALCSKKHLQLYRPPMQIFCVHFLSKIFCSMASHFLLPFFYFCLHLPLSLFTWQSLHMFPGRVLACDAA